MTVHPIRNNPWPRREGVCALTVGIIKVSRVASCGIVEAETKRGRVAAARASTAKGWVQDMAISQDMAVVARAGGEGEQGGGDGGGSKGTGVRRPARSK